MAAAHKVRVPMAEQIRIINECRQSGMTDADWCHENGISVSTFYNWVSRCRKAAADQIPPPNYGHHAEPLPKQDAVPIDIVPDHIHNNADPTLLTRTLRLIQETLCQVISPVLKRSVLSAAIQICANPLMVCVP